MYINHFFRLTTYKHVISHSNTHKPKHILMERKNDRKTTLIDLNN